MSIEQSPHDAEPERPLVSCAQCQFEWFGVTAAHGLSVIGHCPRCGGQLRFHDEEPVGSGAAAAAELEAATVTAAAATDAGESEEALQPWQVLGAPTSWAGH